MSQPLGFFYCNFPGLTFSYCLFPIDIFLTCENSVSSRVFYVFFWSPFTAWTETSYPSLPSKVGIRSGFGQFPARIYGWTRSTYSGWCVSTIQIGIWILFPILTPTCSYTNKVIYVCVSTLKLNSFSSYFKNLIYSMSELTNLAKIQMIESSNCFYWTEIRKTVRVTFKIEYSK